MRLRVEGRSQDMGCGMVDVADGWTVTEGGREGSHHGDDANESCSGVGVNGERKAQSK